MERRGNGRKQKRAQSTNQPTKQPRKPGRPPIRLFSTDEKMAAVTAMVTVGKDHPMGARALAEARRVLGVDVHHETLRTWYKEYLPLVEKTIVTKPATDIILEQQADTLSRLAAARDLALDQITDKEKAKAASYRDSAVVFGITDDHLKTATSITPAVIALWQEYERTCDALGVLPEDIFQDVIVWLKSRLPSLKSIARDAQQDTDSTIDSPPTGSDT